MTDRDPILSAAEQRLLDFGLGLKDELPAGPETQEASDLRELVARVRASAESVQAPAASERVAILVGAARELADRPALPTPSFWQLLEGGLRTSLLLRVVAASLVVHLCALPVLAWLHFSTPERGALWIHFEEPPPVLTSEPQPELLEPVVLPEVPGLHETSHPVDPAAL